MVTRTNKNVTHVLLNGVNSNDFDWQLKFQQHQASHGRFAIIIIIIIIIITIIRFIKRLRPWLLRRY